MNERERLENSTANAAVLLGRQPAFPSGPSPYSPAMRTQGLSVREWIAGQCLASLASMALRDDVGETGQPLIPAPELAEIAVELTDALLLRLSREG